MKIIKRNEVIERVIGGKEVYMLIPIGPTTMIEELAEAKGFCVAEVETEKKRKRNRQSLVLITVRSARAISDTGQSPRSLTRSAAVSRPSGTI